MIAEQNPSHLEFPNDPMKTREVILWVANKRKKVSDYQIVKTIHLANKYHLNNYGWPVIGGHYYAMPEGPVLSEVLSWIQKAAPRFRHIFFWKERVPFKLTEQGMENGKNSVEALRGHDPRYLSKSDIESLERAWEQIKDLSEPECEKLFHDSIWQKRWKNKDKDRRGDMYFEDFFDNQSEKSKELIGSVKPIM